MITRYPCLATYFFLTLCIAFSLFVGQVFACEVSSHYLPPEGDLQPSDEVPRVLPRAPFGEGARTENEVVEGKKRFFTYRITYDAFDNVVAMEADLPFGYTLSERFVYHDNQHPFYHTPTEEWRWFSNERESSVSLVDKNGKEIASERRVCGTDGALIEKTHGGSRIAAYTILVMLSGIIGIDPPERSEVVDS
ncbi:MAG: hypothetical protein OXB96_02840 [Candidatus Kaiserbacteria bacterium]|nr:hypothetical protein [Candidatus Kaiserbacteria bacterium]